MRIAIVTDSAAAIAPDDAQTAEQMGGFAIVPMPVRINDGSGDRELLGLSADEIDRDITIAHVMGHTVGTSSPAPGSFAQVYTQLADEGYEHIISIHLSGALSGTVESARAASRLVSVPVSVIDSRTVAGAYGHIVMKLHELAVTGEYEAQQLVEYARAMAEQTTIYFMIPTLDALRRGGRVSPALAMVGQMFRIRPIGTVTPEGTLTYVDRPRTTARAKERLVELSRQASADHANLASFAPELLDTLVPTGKVVAIHHSATEREAYELQDALGAIAKSASFSALPPVLSAHAGLGALAVVVY